LHVLVNASSARLGGGVTVLRNLLPALAREDAGAHRYLVLARPELRHALGVLPDRVALADAPLNGAARLAWEQLALPLRAFKARADVVLQPAGVAALAATVPQVLLVQNVAPFDDDVVARAPSRLRPRLVALRELGRASARAARRVVFLSEWARRHVGPQLCVSDERAAVIPLGRDEAFALEPRVQRGEFVRRAEGATSRGPLGGDDVLCVSQLYHYKNLPQLVLGFARAVDALPPSARLLIAGDETEPEVAQEILRVARASGIEERVELLGHVPYEELPALYARARVFAFPSSCENFPNILIEALASGVPVVCSRSGPMPEIAGDAAELFDPFDPDEIAACLVRVFHVEQRRAELAQRGPERAARYSWGETARQLLTVLREAAR
jgi:glycosyltransferase involved in cell wall biosynthesis